MHSTHKILNRLCASLMPRSVEELRSRLPLCRDADMIELRLDELPSPDFALLRSLVQQPCIAAVRTVEEGGRSQIAPEHLGAVLASAARAGMEYIDVAWRYADAILPHLHNCTADIVLSHHTDIRNANELAALAHTMMQTPASIYKLVFTAYDPSDITTALRLCSLFAANKRRFVVHAMGEAGTPSRLACAVRGNAWSYVSLHSETETAPGQITLDEARRHDLPNKMQGALLLGLLGYPTAHSRGKFLHNALLAQSFRETSVPWLYMDVPTPDIGNFKAWGAAFSGMSVTLPHKERIVAQVDKCSDDVRRSGVCNTLVRHNRRWYGYNTDMAALRALLQPHCSFLDSGVLVVGTGGTARSTIAVLQEFGLQRIVCVGRNRERGQYLASLFGIDFTTEVHSNERFGAMIQTTSVGMAPRSNERPAVADLLRQGMLALDVVYTPPVTPFAALAHERGCTVLSGVDMFILQAVEQFRLFTGIHVQHNDVRRAWQYIAPYTTGDKPQNNTQRSVLRGAETNPLSEDRSAQTPVQDTVHIHCGTVRGTAVAPPSKSMTHRLLVQGALSSSPLYIERPLWSEDTLVTAAALEALGYSPEGSTDYALLQTQQQRPEECSINLKNSGTSARFLVALAATEEGTTTVLDGSARMQQRPVQEIIDALRQLGAKIDDTRGSFPIRIHGARLSGRRIALQAARSSQFLSALMLIAPRISGQMTIDVQGPIVSEPYIAMTLSMMNAAGVHAERNGTTFDIETGRLYRGGRAHVEGDYSGAAFLLAAAVVSGGELTVEHLSSPSLQGDAAIVDILRLFGAHTEHSNNTVYVAGAPLHAVDTDMNRVPDLVPVTAVVAMFANGRSRLRNVAHLAFKESDRLSAIIENAEKMGGCVYRDGNDLVVEPRPLHGARIDPHNDHRIAMSFAVAGLRVPGVEIAQPECVEKSYPDFWTSFFNLVR